MLDSFWHKKNSTSDAIMPYVTSEIYYRDAWSYILIVQMKKKFKTSKKKKIFLLYNTVSCISHHSCFLASTSPSPRPSVLPADWLCIDYCKLPCVLVRSTLYYQRQGTFWHLLICECCWIFVRWKSNCNLTVQNSTPAVSAFYVLQGKGSLLLANLQRMTDHRPKMHMHFLHWPAQPLLSL